MSGRRHKKLNHLIEFSNSIFTKFYFKHVGVELTFKINCPPKFFLFEAIYLSSSWKKNEIFQEDPPAPHPPPPLESPPGLSYKPVVDTSRHSPTFYNIENSSFVQNRTLVKLLGQRHNWK